MGGFAVSEYTVCDRVVNNKVEKVCMEKDSKWWKYVT